MTEMSPLGTLGTMKPEYAGLPATTRLDIQEKQGYSPFGVEMKVTDDENVEHPWDGKTFGRLKVRGPAVARAYYGGAGDEQFDDEGWFDTGDVAHIDADGYMQITDRAKDVIKSGGEWISTIDLENLAVGHPDVAEAAVIGVAIPNGTSGRCWWSSASPARSRARRTFWASWTARWPNGGCRTTSPSSTKFPHTATGKIQKTTLREQFKGYKLPTE